MGYGDGTVFQRSYDGRWIGRIEAGRDAAGRRIRVQVSATTREHAEEKLDKIRHRFSNTDSITPDERRTG